MQPAVYWKAERQQQRFNLARALNPAYAYRGTLVSAASIAPITATQFCVNGLCLKAYSAGGSKPTDAQALLSAALGGVTSALIMSPCQTVEINQQKHGGSMMAMWRRVVSEYGFFGIYRAYLMTAMREGIFCCTYMAAAPILKERLLHSRPDMPETGAGLLASLLAGAAGAFLTHPADTLKTRLQGDLFPEEPGGKVVNTNVRTAIAVMRFQGNLAVQLYAGFAPRLLRLVCCTYIYGGLKAVFEPMAHTALYGHEAEQ